MEIIPSAVVLQPPPSGLPPVINLAPRDMTALADELLAYHAYFAPLFHRTEQRSWALTYLQGQLADLERKSIEPMALALADGNVQAMQQFISLGAWDDAAVLETHQQLVADTLGDQDTGVLILDGCDFPKQGAHSVGVARQWCGALGKVANCQASVVACYASQHGYTLVDRQLYMPKQWFTPAYQDRRDRCGVPADLAFQTQSELAWALIERLHEEQVLPFQWVIADEHFGNNPTLVDHIAAADLYYLMEVPHDTLVWQQRPATAVPPLSGKKGRPPQRARLVAEARDHFKVGATACSSAPSSIPLWIRSSTRCPFRLRPGNKRSTLIFWYQSAPGLKWSPVYRQRQRERQGADQPRDAVDCICEPHLPGSSSAGASSRLAVPSASAAMSLEHDTDQAIVWSMLFSIRATQGFFAQCAWM